MGRSTHRSAKFGVHELLELCVRDAATAASCLAQHVAHLRRADRGGERRGAGSTGQRRSEAAGVHAKLRRTRRVHAVRGVDGRTSASVIGLSRRFIISFSSLAEIVPSLFMSAHTRAGGHRRLGQAFALDGCSCASARAPKIEKASSTLSEAACSSWRCDMRSPPVADRLKGAFRRQNSPRANGKFLASRVGMSEDEKAALLAHVSPDLAPFVQDIMYTESQLRERAAAMGAEITAHYRRVLRPGEQLIVVGLLKGGLAWMHELTMRLAVVLQSVAGIKKTGRALNGAVS